MILIGDSGSTSTNWAMLQDKTVVKEITTDGFNPYYYSPDVLQHALRIELNKVVEADKISHVYYYAAGCSTDANCSLVRNAFNKLFPNALIEIEHENYPVHLLYHYTGLQNFL